MTPEQADRLIAAVNNCATLLTELNGYDGDPIETFIEIFNGKADDLTKKETTMPRGRKKKTTDVAANSTPAPTAPVQHVAVPADQTQLITAWKAAADQLKEVKDKEHAMRQAIVAQMFTALKLEGTEAVDIGWGYKLKAVKEMNYTATNDNNEIQNLLTALEERGADELANDLVNWKPEVSKPTYRKVCDMAREYNDTVMLELLHKAITLKPGMPKLEMVAPGQETQPESPSVSQPPTYIIEQNFLPE